MTQLSLFPRSQVASWRDRTASRNYSPAGEQFRQERARHREWGLRQRHGRKAMYLRLYVGIGVVSGPSAPESAPPSVDRLPVAPSIGGVPAGQGLAWASEGQDGDLDPAAETTAAQAIAPTGQAARTDQAVAADQAADPDQADQADQAAHLAQAAHAARLMPAGEETPAGRLLSSRAGPVAAVGLARRVDRTTPSVGRFRRSGRARRSGQDGLADRPRRIGPSVRPPPAGNRAPPLTRNQRPTRIEIARRGRRRDGPPAWNTTLTESGTALGFRWVSR
jgi:hypothetical protein